MKTIMKISSEDLLSKLKDYAAAFLPDMDSPARKMQQTRYNAITDMIQYIEEILREDEEDDS